MGAHILIVGIAAIGHVNYSLPAAAELVRRGHRVTYLTSKDLAPVITPSGAGVIHYDSILTRVDATQVFAEGGDGNRAHMLYLDENVSILRAAEAALDEDPPDLVAYDTFPFIAGKLLARRWARPAARLYPNFADNEHFSYMKATLDASTFSVTEQFVTEMGALLREYGVEAPVPEFETTIEDLNIVFIPREFQIADETFDERFLFVGPCLDAEDHAGAWTPPADGRPVVLVTLGTGINNHPEFFRACAEASAGMPWHTVMSVGQWVDLEGLRPLPPNVEAHRWVPHMAVLEHAQACVTNAGFGTVMQSLYWARPIVAVPHSPEVRPIAERVVELGLGRMISSDGYDAVRLRRAIQEVSADTAMTRHLREMQRRVRHETGPAEAADGIEGYLERVRDLASSD
ncbi:glycosyltransferase [Actinoallomurus acanthiterrae]